MVIIILTITSVGTIAIVLLVVRWIMKRRTTEDVEKTKVRRDKELAFAAESLELIANDIDEWIKQQRDKFMHTSMTFRKKWISRWFSDFRIMELLKDRVHKRRFDEIVNTFRLYIPNLVEPLKEIWNNFLSSARFMKQIEMHKGSLGGAHDLGHWCGNFLDKTARPTAKSLLHLAEQTRKHLTAQKQVKKKEERLEEELNKQVGKLAAQKQVKKKEERPEGVLNKQVGKLPVQKQVKKKEERPEKKLRKQVSKLTAQKHAKKKEERPDEVLNKQVGKLLESSPDITASEIARMLNKNYDGVYKPISPDLVVKTENWKKYLEKVTVSGQI